MHSIDLLTKHYDSIPGKLLRRNADSLLLNYEPVSPRAAPVSELAPRQKWLTIATSDVDRAGDIMVMAGVQLDNFRKNPQFLWQHGLTPLPLHTLGRILEVRATDNALYALAEYANEEVFAFAEQIHRMDQKGYLPANSIGFRPIEWEENEHGGFTFLKWELVEVSKVDLPMNPNAIDASSVVTLAGASEWLAR